MRVMNEAQIRDCVFDLFALIEASPPHQPVFHTTPDKLFFQYAALSIGAIHHSTIPRGNIGLCLKPGNLTDDQARFILLIVGLDHLDLHPLAPLGEKILVHAVLVLADDMLGRIQNSTCRTIILLQQNETMLGKVITEAKHISIVGPTPAINALILISDDE